MTLPSPAEAIALSRRRVLSAAAAACAWTPSLRAQPAAHTAPVKLVVGFPAGGPADIGLRIVAEGLAAQGLRRLVVDNRPGAGGTIAADAVAHAAPDGQTLLLSGNHLVIAQLLTAGARYDAVRSYTPVARFAVVPSGLFVNAASPFESLGDLLAHARKAPDKLSYASGGNGTPSHLAMELLKRRAGLAIQHVPYKGTPPAVTDLIGGQVDMLFTSIAGPMAQVRSGRLKLLGLSSPQRLPSLPQVPVIAEAVPGYEFETWLGLSAPAGTPAAVVSALSAEIGQVLKDPRTLKRLEDAGLAAAYTPAAELEARVQAEALAYARLVRDANIRSE